MRAFAFALAVCLALGPLGCGGDDESPSPPPRVERDAPPTAADIAAIERAAARIKTYCRTHQGAAPSAEVSLLLREYRAWPLGEVRINGKQTRLLDVVVAANGTLVEKCSRVQAPLAGSIYRAIEARGDDNKVLH